MGVGGGSEGREGEGGREKKDRRRGRKSRAGIPSLCHKDLVHTLLLEQLNNFRAQHGGGDSDGSGHLQTADGMIPPPAVRQRGSADQTFNQPNGEFYIW